jgi:hypothetical protein
MKKLLEELKTVKLIGADLRITPLSKRYALLEQNDGAVAKVVHMRQLANLNLAEIELKNLRVI